MLENKKLITIKNNQRLINDITKDIFYSFRYFFFSDIIKAIKYNPKKEFGNVLNNEIEAIRTALYNRDIYYKQGHLYSKNNRFSSRLSAILRQLGTYSISKKAFKINIHNPALSTINADIQIINSEQEKKTNKILYLIGILAGHELYFNSEKDSIKSYIEELSSRIERLTGSSVKWRNGHYEQYIKSFVYNVNRSMNKFKTEEVEKIRKKISQAMIEDNISDDELEKIVEHEIEVAKSRAKMIADGESRQIKSSILKKKSLEAGIDKYIWRTKGDEKVRPANKYQARAGWNHRYLDGKLCSFSNPPITNFVTMGTASAGEDFNCRCEAILVPPSEEYKYKNSWLLDDINKKVNSKEKEENF